MIDTKSRPLQRICPECDNRDTTHGHGWARADCDKGKTFRILESRDSYLHRMAAKTNCRTGRSGLNATRRSRNHEDMEPSGESAFNGRT